MARRTPSVTAHSTALAARSTSSAAASNSALRMRWSTYAERSPTGWSGWIPSRRRTNSSVPSAPITDFSPLCPPALPRSRMRRLPQGSATSSTTIRICAGATSYRSASSRTAIPLRFMYVCGLASATSCSPMRPLPTYDLASGRSTRMPARSATRSITRKPRLWGVQAYSNPGFPSPTMSHMRHSEVPAGLYAERRGRPGGPLLLLLLLFRFFRLFRLFGFLGLLGRGRALFSLFFLLALLDDLGFGRRDRHGRFRSDFFFLLRGHDVRDHGARLADQLHLLRVERQVGEPQRFAQGHLRDVHPEVIRNVAGKAFDLHLARHDLEHAALLLDAHRLAESTHRHADAHAHVFGHAQQVHVQQIAHHRVGQPVFEHGELLALSLELDVEQRVVSRLRAEQRRELMRIERQGHDLALPAVEHSRHGPGAPQPPHGILPAIFPYLSLKH